MGGDYIEHGMKMLKALQAMSLDDKIEMSRVRIAEWYKFWDGDVCISFSGGKDSTVLRDLVHSMYPEVPCVWVNTGLEYPEIQEFVKSDPDSVIVRPAMDFKSVITEYGYPLISKEVSEAIYYARRKHPKISSGGGGYKLRAGASRPINQTKRMEPQGKRMDDILFENRRNSSASEKEYQETITPWNSRPRQQPNPTGGQNAPADTPRDISTKQTMGRKSWKIWNRGNKVQI